MVGREAPRHDWHPTSQTGGGGAAAAATVRRPGNYFRKRTIMDVMVSRRTDSGPTLVLVAQITQHLADRGRAAAAGDPHGILHEPLSGVRVEDGIAQMAFKR